MSWTTLKTRAEEWQTQDPDPETRAELGELIGRGEAAATELAERFAGPLEFGTAGLRGIIGAGESRMNRAVVIRATWGLGTWLLEQDAARARQAGVVIGYDGRRMSLEFARDAAGVLAGLSIPVLLSTKTCPTPLCAFAVTHFGAAAGIMVTASHNPPEYNGYKVYAGNGAQIIPPTDEQIAAAIARSPAANEVRLMDLEDASDRGLLRYFDRAEDRAYLDAVRALSVRSDGRRDLPIVYTPLHGVGKHLLALAMEEAGFSAVSIVSEQAEPDGAFPTVAFPNPEEKGAMDLSLALARREQAAIVLANDPDADRLAIAVHAGEGRYVQLTGNEVGVLLGHYLLTEGPGASGDRVVMASLVSSPMLGVIARELGVRYEETLTGFKWIANLAIDIEARTGARFVFGYEEALGYTVGTVVRDKDGISAAVIAAELAAVRAAAGKTLLDELADVSRRYGLFVSGQRSETFPGSAGAQTMAKLMDTLRAAPPTAIGGIAVLATRDYQARVRTTRGGDQTPIPLPRSNVLAFELEGDNRVIARPSGTEPKIKFYFDVKEAMREGEAYDAAKARAQEQLDRLAAAFLKLAGL